MNRKSQLVPLEGRVSDSACPRHLHSPGGQSVRQGLELRRVGRGLLCFLGQGVVWEGVVWEVVYLEGVFWIMEEWWGAYRATVVCKRDIASKLYCCIISINI